jgi:hypothetical protein
MTDSKAGKQLVGKAWVKGIAREFACACRFAIAHLKGVEQAILRDNDEPDNYYICHGMRVISILRGIR